MFHTSFFSVGFQAYNHFLPKYPFKSLNEIGGCASLHYQNSKCWVEKKKEHCFSKITVALTSACRGIDSVCLFGQYFIAIFK